MGAHSKAAQGPRRTRTAVAAAIAVALIAGLWLGMGGGGDDPGSAAPAWALADRGEPTDSKERPSKARSEAPVETLEVFAPRDPFDPVVTEASGRGDKSAEAGGGVAVAVAATFADGGRETARVQVDGTAYTVAEGDVFAESFQVTSIDSKCVTMLYGDDQFTLCRGEQIRK